MNTKSHRLTSVIALVTSLTCFAMPASAVNLQIIGEVGQAAPDGNGVIDALNAPVLNDNGRVAFFTRFDETNGNSLDDVGILLWDGAQLLTVAREGQTVPTPPFTVPGLYSNRFGLPSIGNNNQVAFTVETAFGGIVSEHSHLGQGGANTLEPFIEEGQAAPGPGGGVISGGAQFSTFGNSLINDNGQVALVGRVSTNGILTGEQAIFTGSPGAGNLIEVTRRFDPAPSGNGAINLVFDPDLSDSGSVVFKAALRDTTLTNPDRIGEPGFGDDDEVILFHGNAGLVEAVREGQTAPGGGVFRNRSGGLPGAFGDNGIDPLVNDSDHVAFVGLLAETTGGMDDDSGIFVWDGTQILEVAREGDTIPGGSGNTFADFGNDFFVPGLAFNGNDQIVFTNNTSSGLGGLFRGNQQGIELIARRGDPTPSGDGTINAPREDVTANESGQIAFLTSLIGASQGFADALFVYDDQQGLIEIIREKTPFDGSTVQRVQLESGLNIGGRTRSPLNDAGQLVFEVELADGREFTVLADISGAAIPEPSSLLLCVSGMVLIVLRTRRL